MARLQVLIAVMEEGVPVNLGSWLDAAEGAAVLRRVGIRCEVVVVKSLRQREDLITRLKDDPPHILFLPVDRDQLHPANALLLGLRKSSLPMVTAVGGAMGTLGADIFTFNPATTAVILGEWQPLLTQFARAFLANASGADVRGVWWRGRTGWHLTPAVAPLPNLDDLPQADFSALPVEELLKINGRTLPLLASRGCPFSCSFCHVPMMRKLERPDTNYRSRTPEKVVEHAAAMVERYDVRRFEFVDELFPWQDAWLERFVTLWSDRVARPFRWRSAVEQMTREKINALARAGGDTVEIGIETGDERRRSTVADRNVSNRSILRATEMARDAGVRVAASMMLGLPRTDRDELIQSVEFLRQLKPDEIAHTHYEPWPRKANWSETEHAGLELTGLSIRGGAASATSPRASVQEARELKWAVEQFRRLDCEGRARSIPRGRDVIFDGIAALGDARIRSPLANPIRIDTFHAANGSHPVLAMRVPCEVSWEVDLPESPMLEFGMLLEPTLPGLRTRTAIVFNVKLEQADRSYRLFQKVLVQALDPDSRRWHRFALPLRPGIAGPARISIDNLIFGKDASAMPTDGDVWAGWSSLTMRSSAAPDTLSVE